MMKKWTMVMLCLLLTAGQALAEPAVSREEIEAMKEKLKALEQKLAPEGEPKWYDKVDLSLSATGVVQGTTGVKDSLRPGGNLTSATMNVDIEAAAEVVPQGSLFVHFKAGAGKGLDGDIGSLSGFNNLAVDEDKARLWEVWYEHKWLDQMLRFRVGKLDLTTDFDTNQVANDDATQFISSGFVNNLGVEFPDDNAPGAMLWFSPHKLIDLGVGVADATGSWEGIDKNPFVIGEVAFKPTIGGRQGNYRFYGWLNGKDHTEWKDATKTKERNIGFGLSFDQALSDAITAFARYGRQDQKVAQVDQAWSAGLELSGGLYGREKDALGMAYGMALLGKDYEEVTQAGGTLIGDEQHAEIYYRWHVHDHLEISPNVQWIRNINGESAHGDVWAFGVRAHASF